MLIRDSAERWPIVIYADGSTVVSRGDIVARPWGLCKGIKKWPWNPNRATLQSQWT